MWNPPGAKGITVFYMEIEVRVPEEQLITLPVWKFASTVAGSGLVGILFGVLMFWVWLRISRWRTKAAAKSRQNRSGISDATTSNNYEVSKDDSVTAARGDLERGAHSADGDGLIATDVGYRGLPEPGDRNDRRFDTGASSMPPPYVVHGRGPSASRHGFTSRPGSASASVGPVLEPVQEDGEGNGAK